MSLYKLKVLGGLSLGLALACGSSDKDDPECTTSTGEECDPDTFADTGDTCTCTDGDNTDPTDSGDTDTDDTGDTGNADTGDTAGTAWIANASPCGGSRMDALYCTSETDCFVGCGSNAKGQGLHVTTDGGASWSNASDSASGTFFESFRVLDIDVSPTDDSVLAVSGTSDAAYRVVYYNTGSGDLEEVYNNFSNIDYTMTVGNFAENAEGVQIAESLTGTGLIVRKNNDSDFLTNYEAYDGWGSAYGWWNSTPYPENVQVLDMAVINEQFVGVGAQINTPPVVYLPPRSWPFATSSNGDSYLDQMFETINLADGFDAYIGECWQIDANGDGLAVVCVNQDADHGRVYTIGPNWTDDGYDAANWTATSMEDIVEAATVLEHSTWNEGVCRGPDNDVTVVGRDSQTDVGYVVRSTDGGSTWTEITADVAEAYGGDFSPVTRCTYVGDHLVIGGSGIIGYAALADL